MHHTVSAYSHRMPEYRVAETLSGCIIEEAYGNLEFKRPAFAGSILFNSSYVAKLLLSAYQNSRRRLHQDHSMTGNIKTSALQAGLSIVQLQLFVDFWSIGKSN